MRLNFSFSSRGIIDVKFTAGMLVLLCHRRASEMLNTVICDIRTGKVGSLHVVCGVGCIAFANGPHA